MEQIPFPTEEPLESFRLVDSETEDAVCPDLPDCDVRFDAPEPEVGFPGIRICETHGTNLPVYAWEA